MNRLWRQGDTVEVTAGPRLAKTGQIVSARHGEDGLEYQVFFDECCQPFINRRNLRMRQRSVGFLRRPFSRAGRLQVTP